MKKECSNPIPLNAEQMKEVEKQEQLQALLTGKTPSPNKYVSFMLQKLREAKLEHETLKQRLEQGRAAIVMLEEKTIQVQAIHNNYIRDLEMWLEEPESKGGKE